jgi:hypothetical protein
MELLDLILPMLAIVLTPIMTYFILERQKKKVIAWCLTQEGLSLFATIGASFASGAMTQLKMGKAAKGIKIMGITIPQQIVDAAAFKIAQVAGLIPKETSETPQ